MSNPGFGQREPYPGYPPPLTTQPEGLLQLLGIQNSGRYPQHLAMDWLHPTLDLLPWYLQQRAEVINATVPMASKTTGSFTQMFQVPQGEHWILLDLTWQCTVSAGAAGTQVWRLVRARANDALSKFELGPQQSFDGTTSLPLLCTDGGNRGILLRPTVQLGIYIELGGSAAACTGLAACRFVRLRTGSSG